MSDGLRVFVNSALVEVSTGSDVRAALHAHDPALEASAAAGTALITDARGIALPLDAPLEAGSILRVVVRARRAQQDADADA